MAQLASNCIFSKILRIEWVNKTLIVMKRNFRISFIKFIWDKMQCYATDIFSLQYTLELITEFLPNSLEWKAPGIKFCLIIFHDDFFVVLCWWNLLIWQKS